MDDQIINFVASAYVNEMAEETGFWNDHYLGGIYAYGASLGHIQINQKGEQWVIEVYEALQSRQAYPEKSGHANQIRRSYQTLQA